MERLKKIELKKLGEQRAKIIDRINELENEEIEKTQYPRINAMVGMCYRYYSNAYCKILELVMSKEYGPYFILEQVEINEQGEASMLITSNYPYLNKEWWGAEIPISGAEKISTEEYEKAKADMWKEMALRNKLRKFLTKRK